MIHRVLTYFLKNDQHRYLMEIETRLKIKYHTNKKSNEKLKKKKTINLS